MKTCRFGGDTGVRNLILHSKLSKLVKIKISLIRETEFKVQAKSQIHE